MHGHTALSAQRPAAGATSKTTLAFCFVFRSTVGCPGTEEACGAATAEQRVAAAKRSRTNVAMAAAEAAEMCDSQAELAAEGLQAEAAAAATACGGRSWWQSATICRSSQSFQATAHV